MCNDCYDKLYNGWRTTFVKEFKTHLVYYEL